MDPITFIAYTVALGMLTLGALWFFEERRRAQDYKAKKDTSTFCCVKCRHLYASKGTVSSTLCPHCGQSNVKLKF